MAETFQARSEKINEFYVGRVLRLTLLAPDVIETIVNGRQPEGLQLDVLMKRFPVGWEEQRTRFFNAESANIQRRPSINEPGVI